MFGEKSLKLNRIIFTSSICLKLFNVRGELIFYKKFEFDKVGENFRFFMQWIYPCESGKIINENDMIFVTTNRLNRRSPHIRMNKF
jgi:hypothetical protein